MAEQPIYVTTDTDGNITLEPDAHINDDNIDMMTFKFTEGKDITESVSKKSVKNKNPVSYTQKGRTGYAPVSVVYPDGDSTSSKFLLENCIVQYTQALNTANYSYAKDFVFIGVPTVYIDKIIKDAKDESSIELRNKANVQEDSGYYFQRCTLEKLSHKNTSIVTPDGSVNVSIDSILKEAKKSLVASITFSLSGSITNNNMAEELDLKDGTYYISMKPTEVFISNTSDVQGPQLVDTNNRKKESSGISESFIATGPIAEMAAKRLRGGRKA